MRCWEEEHQLILVSYYLPLGLKQIMYPINDINYFILFFKPTRIIDFFKSIF